MNDARNSDNLKTGIYIKTEYKDSAEYDVPGINHNVERENGFEDEVADDRNAKIEEIYIKSEPVDTSEFEHELEGTAAANTACSASSVNPEESCVPVAVNKLKHTNTAVTTEIYYKCDICDKRFAQARYLASHKPVHIGEKRFKCDQCNMAFSRKSVLKRHKLIHSGEMKYKCEECNKSFSQKVTLINHERTHSGEKPFKCDRCSEAFSRNSLLNIHKRIHAGEKPFKCNQCNEAFTSASFLVTHKRFHSGGKPSKCEKFNKTFNQRNTITDI